MQRTFYRAVIVAALLLAHLTSVGSANDKTAADLMPGTTFLYAELPRPKPLITLSLDHPISKQLQENEAYQKAIETPQYKQLKAVIGLIEKNVGVDWRPALESLTAGGLYLGVDAKTQGLVVLVRSDDPELLQKTLGTLIELARADAKQKGQNDPIETSSYRDIPAHRAQELRLAIVGPWLVLTNKDDLGKHVLDNYLDKPRVPLSGNQQFSQAKSKVTGEPSLWSYVDLSIVRLAPNAKDLAQGKAENPGAEILVGGILATLSKAPYATAMAYMEQDSIKFSFMVPHDDAWIAESRQYFFGEEGKGPAPAPLKPKEAILSISTVRDLPSFWTSAADLFDDNTNAELAKAESGISTLFSGHDFGQEILGAFDPQLRIVAARQTFADGDYPVPAIKIPSFAMVVRLKDPEVMVGEFKRTFQSLIGFLNVAGAQNGQPQLDFNIEKSQERLMVTTSYAYEKRDKGTKQGKIHFNFSPSIGFVGEHMVIASTSALATELADLLSTGTQTNPAAPPSEKVVNTLVNVDAHVLGDVLEDNRRQLVSQNMLEEGHSKEEAEKEIGVLLTLVGLFKDASIELVKAPKYLHLDIGLTLQAAK